MQRREFPAQLQATGAIPSAQTCGAVSALLSLRLSGKSKKIAGMTGMIIDLVTWAT
jgi:hypothetical protein